MLKVLMKTTTSGLTGPQLTPCMKQVSEKNKVRVPVPYKH